MEEANRGHPEERETSRGGSCKVPPRMQERWPRGEQTSGTTNVGTRWRQAVRPRSNTAKQVEKMESPHSGPGQEDHQAP